MIVLVRKLTHPSVLGTASSGVTLAVLNVIGPVPWWLWAAWGVLGAVSVVQAARSER